MICLPRLETLLSFAMLGSYVVSLHDTVTRASVCPQGHMRSEGSRGL